MEAAVCVLEVCSHLSFPAPPHLHFVVQIQSPHVLDAFTVFGEMLISFKAEMVKQTGRNVPISICQQHFKPETKISTLFSLKKGV